MDEEFASEPADRTNSKKVKPWPEPLDEIAYYGVLGKIVKEIEPYIEADSAALLINLIVASGIAVGRKPYLQVGPHTHRCVLNATTVGETGDNKTDGTALLRSILEAVKDVVDGYVPLDMDIPIAPPITSGLSTGEGLLYQIRDERWEKRQDNKNHTVQNVLVDAGVLDKRLLVIEAEFCYTHGLRNEVGKEAKPSKDSFVQ